MGIYKRHDSPFYWLLLERPGLKPILESSKIPVEAYAAEIRKQNRQAVQDVYASRMADLARGRAELPLHKAKVVLFKTYADWYKKQHTAHHRGAERELDAIAILTKTFGPLALTDISQALVQEYLTARVADGCRPGTANREVDVLKSMMRVAAAVGHLKVSPLVGMKRLRTVKRKKRVVDVKEEPRLLKALPARDRALYIVAVDTLARLSNVLHLKRSEDKGTHLALEDSKTGPYEVPLSARARKALDALPNTGEYYFQHRRGAKTQRDARGAIRRMLERACASCKPPIPYGRAVAGVTFHTATRATGATRMLRAGVDPKTVQEIGNWDSLESMGEYLVTDEHLKHQAVNLIGRQRTTPQLRSLKVLPKKPMKSRAG